jgi:hypothetical protein
VPTASEAEPDAPVWELRKSAHRPPCGIFPAGQSAFAAFAPPGRIVGPVTPTRTYATPATAAGSGGAVAPAREAQARSSRQPAAMTG